MVEAKPAPFSYAIEAGTAGHVGAEYGARYLALPRRRRGTLVRVCGAAGCVVRRSVDAGLDQRRAPDRIADLSEADFATVSGLSPSSGECVVTVEYLEE